MMMHHQPAAAALNKKVGRGCESRVEASLVENRDVLSAGNPGKIAFGANPNLGRCSPQFLPARKDDLPASAHSIPSCQKIPARMHTSNPLLVSPHLIHPFEHSRFERPVESCIRLFDQNAGFDTHTRARLYLHPAFIQVAKYPSVVAGFPQ